MGLQMHIGGAKISLESLCYTTKKTKKIYSRDQPILKERGNKGHINNQPSQKYSWHFPRLQNK